MHYYQFNIGDYKSHTEHLSEMEDLAYRRLLDWYYLHESPIPLEVEESSRLIRMRSHTECITTVLREFFKPTDNGWVHGRADKEIAKTGEKSAKASESAKRRWEKEANAMRTHSDGNATHNTVPITQDTKPKTQEIQAPEGVSDQVWQDFKKSRKTLRAAMTKSAIDGIQREANKAGWPLEDALRECCVRGWRGFKAEWVADKGSPAKQQKTFAERDREAGMARWEEQTGRIHPDRQQSDQSTRTGQVVDVTLPFLEIEQ